MYTPILRNRQSEMRAFLQLPADVYPHMRPLFDVAAPTKDRDQAAAEKYVLKNITQGGKSAQGFADVLIDSSELPPDFRLPGGVHPLTAAAAAIADAGVRPVPVTGLHRDQAHHDAAMDLRQQSGGLLCLRLDATDVSTARMTYLKIKDVLATPEIATGQVALLLDMQGLYGQEPMAVAASVLRLLSLLKQESWLGVIIAGDGLPEQLSTAVQPNAQDYVPRVEQAVFFQLRAQAAPLSIWFGDYATLPPSVVELDWRLISKVMAPKALYTLDDTWLVVRGGAFSRHPDGYGQYYDIADEIVALDEFCGADYSAGDQYMALRAVRAAETGGSPASWITACVNHHITLTARTHAMQGT